LLRAGFSPPSASAAQRDYTRTASRLAPGLYELTGRSMAAFCRLQRGRCLDVGCGKADLDIVLAKITELTILGLDIDEAVLTKARAKPAGFGPGVRRERSDSSDGLLGLCGGAAVH
jgi:ubiquinone/menaquinone biosynthesis C-methylase UbiE